jgi:ferric-dicitrate binding protein FerR (iron transport regulator)
MESEEKLFEKISEYYSGEENRKAVKKELEQLPESRELFLWIDLLWNSIKPRVWHSENIQKRTHEKINRGQRPAPSFLLRAVKYAAIVLLALSISGIAYYYSRENIQVIEVTSGTGQIEVVELPDGSMAWLNAQSSLRYPEKFKGELREVTMTGEVYFEVKPDGQHPFIVSSGTVQVKVLGTSFLVSNYTNDPGIHTYLEKGSIELKLKDLKKSLKLIPGDQIFYDKGTSTVTKLNNPHAMIDSWRFGKLSFYNETLFDIARKLERKFGKEIQIPDKNVGNLNYTADFESENLEQILEFFSEGSHIKYITTETGYMIIKK